MATNFLVQSRPLSKIRQAIQSEIQNASVGHVELSSFPEMHLR